MNSSMAWRAASNTVMISATRRPGLTVSLFISRSVFEDGCSHAKNKSGNPRGIIYRGCAVGAGDRLCRIARDSTLADLGDDCAERRFDAPGRRRHDRRQNHDWRQLEPSEA